MSVLGSSLDCTKASGKFRELAVRDARLALGRFVFLSASIFPCRQFDEASTWLGDGFSVSRELCSVLESTRSEIYFRSKYLYLLRLV